MYATTKIMDLIKRCILIAPTLCLVLLSGCRDEKDRFQGYVEGELRYIASNFPGKLIQLRVIRGDQVARNQSLFILEEQPEKSNYLASQNKVVSAQAAVDRLNEEINVLQLKYNRRINLLSKHFSSQEEVDINFDLLQAAKKQHDAALADLEVAKAELERASWEVTKKQYDAPIQSMVFDTFFKPGEYVPAGQPVLALLAKKDIKFVFFVTEQKLSNIKIGQEIAVFCDSCPHALNGTIYYISPIPEFTQPIIYGEQTRGKLTFLIEAHPSDYSANQLHRGQPITVELIP